MSIAPPVTRGAWSYAGDFYVESSGHNRHRRFTIPELKAHFDGSDPVTDRPAHWYEAQLLHYGLPPSKTKGTAKMRLFEAVHKTSLAVPGHILKIEADLRKEWTKKDRALKQALKKVESAPAPTKATKATKKRKADDASGNNINISVNLSIGPQGNLMIGAEPVAKKAKTAKTAAPAKKEVKAKAPAKPKTPAKAPESVSQPRTKQTARRGGSYASPSSRMSQPQSSPAPSAAPRPIKTARRGRPFQPSTPSRPVAPESGRIGFAAYHEDPYGEVSYNEPPPPYPGSPGQPSGYLFSDDMRSDDTFSRNEARPLPPLGLLNGRYDIDVAEWEHVDSGLILTMDGNALWGSFEFGPVRGIFHIEERPRRSSEDTFGFEWRGEDDQDEHLGGSHDGSYIKFVGDGNVEGVMNWNGDMLEFSGRRVSGQGTRSEISAVSMRQQWQQRAPPSNYFSC